MGTPEFAQPPLVCLHKSRHEVVAVVTGRDKPVGRGKKTQPPPVRQLADDLGLPVLMPTSLKSAELQDQIKALSPDLIVVIAFRVLPEKLYTVPRLGAINIHGSLLPKYRGAAPVNWALINGETETGLTSFFLQKKVDTGQIIQQEETEIDDNENFDSLYARLSEMAGPFLLNSLDLIERDDFAPTGQDHSLATPAPKITPFDAMIDWGFPARNVHNFVRGLSSKPAAFTFFRGKKLKVLRSAVAKEKAVGGLRPGSILPDRKRLLIQCAGSCIELLMVGPEGKKLMDGRSFINGFKPTENELFGESDKKFEERN
jgi:methionyl-tRNA formyltransferase